MAFSTEKQVDSNAPNAGKLGALRLIGSPAIAPARRQAQSAHGEAIFLGMNLPMAVGAHQCTLLGLAEQLRKGQLDQGFTGKRETLLRAGNVVEIQSGNTFTVSAAGALSTQGRHQSGLGVAALRSFQEGHARIHGGTLAGLRVIAPHVLSVRAGMFPHPFFRISAKMGTMFTAPRQALGPFVRDLFGSHFRFRFAHCAIVSE